MELMLKLKGDEETAPLVSSGNPLQGSGGTGSDN